VERLTDPAELDLLRRLAAYPRISEAAGGVNEPTPNRVICMILPANSTRFGQRDANCLFTLHYQ